MKKLILILSFACFVLFGSGQNTATFTQHGPVKFPNNPSVQTTGMGRVSQLAYHPTDSNILFAVSASGGIFKSSNEGITWRPLTDFLAQGTCASILINPLNPNIMYLGTGDANYNSAGRGVYKSSDGGQNWVQWNTGMGNKLVTEMVFAPNDTATLVAACSDGIYKSINSGATWVKKTSVNTSYRDISYRPQSNTLLYAASNTNFYRSYDNGETWIQSTLNSGITCAGIKLAVCPSDTSRIYCLAWRTGGSSPFGGIYLSTNNGSSFTLMADTPNILGYSANGSTMDGQGAYNLAIAVDPNNANILYIAAINIWKSTNQGASFSLLSHWAFGVHADKHNFLFSPFNPNKLYLCHDGGLDRSTNGGGSWTTLEDGLSASEFYKMGASGVSKDYLIGGLQDNGEDVAVNKNFSTIRGGDWSGDFAFDAFDSSVVYENGGIKRNIVSNNSFAINGHGGIYLPHPTDSNVMFELDTNVLRTNNLRANPSSGVSWTKISSIPGSLSTGTKSVGYAKTSGGLMYVFFSPQLFYKSTNVNSAIPAFTQITSFPFNSSEVIKQIVTAENDTNTVYVVTNQTRIFKSNNQGVTWVNINKNLPANNFIKFLLDQSANDSGMYVCTAFGVYYRNSVLGNWIPYAQGLPTIAQISDMEIVSKTNNEGRLYISTYGRGIFQSNLYRSNSQPPVADFTIQPNSSDACPNTYLLINHSINNPITKKWSISPTSGWGYMNGTDSLSDRAEIRLNNYGSYFISLTTSNAQGTHIKTDLLNYTPLNAATCSTTTTNLTGYGMGIQRVELNTLNYPSGIGSASYNDFTCKGSTVLKAGTTYSAWVTTGNTNNENQKIYIDYNNNGIFTDANELVGTIASGQGRRSCNISVLASPPVCNQFIRMRVVTNFGTSATPPCGVLGYGESEDYALLIDTVSPIALLNIPKPVVTGSFNATLQVSQAAFGLNQSDILVSNGTCSNFTQTAPTTYSFVINPSVPGKVVVSIAANSFTNYTGNGNRVAIDSTIYQLPAIETAISSKTLNFGPNETDTFYSTAGKMMAILSNLSSFNYGNTTVSIDNSGTGGINYGSNTTNNKKIASKTYTVAPTNNNASGSFSIRLFYTSAEINGWKSTSGNTFAGANIIKCPNNIATGTIANGVYGTGTTTSVYPGTTDSSISAVFNTGFSGFGIGANTIVLPVKLLNFTAEKVQKNVQLNWTTASEINNHYFSVERSIDQNNWQNIGTVAGKNNSQSLQKYQFLDNSIQQILEESTLVFYRLNQVDWDGKNTYSDIRFVAFEKECSNFKIVPMPVAQTLHLMNGTGLGFKYEILDGSGKILGKGSSILMDTDIPLTDLPSGLYYLQIISKNGNNEVLKFIKTE